MSKQTSKALVLLMALMVTACAETPSPKFYVLAAISPAAVPFSATKPRSIGIGPITIPSLLERKQIVTQTGVNEVDIAEFHHWAGPLKDNIIQVLQQNVATLLPNDIVRSYPWSAFGNVNQYIVIDIIRLDKKLGQAATLEANWAIMDEQSHQLLSNGHILINRPLHDSTYQTSTQAISLAISQLSRELALALNNLVEKRE
jgi:uncharacterized lipoprotein YmbA